MARLNTQETRLKAQAIMIRGRNIRASGERIRKLIEPGATYITSADQSEIIAEVAAIETNCRLIREAFGIVEPPAKQDYRLRLTDSLSNVSYLNRRGDRIIYAGASGIPFSLSNICHQDARGMEFALIDAKDGNDARAIIQSYIGGRFGIEVL